MTEKPHVLYRMFNREGDLLYVGITNNPKMRFSTHSKTQPWWSEVANIIIENHSSREDLVYAEQVAIRSEFPLYNIAMQTVVEAPLRPCPTCRAPCTDLMPTDQVLLDEDGSLLPFCTDPYHFPDNPEIAARLHENRLLLKQAGLLRLSELAEERLERHRAAMGALSDLLMGKSS